PTLVHRGTAGRLDGVGHVRGGHRTEQAPVVPGTLRQTHLEGAELSRDLLRLVQAADLPRGASAADRVDLLLAAPRPLDGEPARQQVVAAVAVLHLDDVAGGAETVDLVSQNQLHVVTSSSAPVSERCWCRAAAPS